MYHYALVTPDSESLGVFTFARGHWKPGDVVPQGQASLRVVDVIEPALRSSDGLEVGLLRVEPL